MLKASIRPVPMRKVPAKVPQGVHYSCVHKTLYPEEVSILLTPARVIAFCAMLFGWNEMVMLTD